MRYEVDSGLIIGYIDIVIIEAASSRKSRSSRTARSFQGGKFQMDMSKTVAVAMSGLVLAGAAALAASTATPASAGVKMVAPQSDHHQDKHGMKKRGRENDNGGGGGGGG